MRLRLAVAAMLLVATGTGCSDFFMEPSAGPARIALRITPSIAMQPDTFKSADNGTVRVLAGSDTIKKEDFQHTPGSEEISLQVELPADISQNQVIVEIELRRGKDLLFSGRQTVTLKKGTAQPVEIPVTAIDYCKVVEPVSIGETKSESLVRDRDCIEPNGLMQRRFLLTLPAPAVFTASLTSSAFAPRLEIRQPVAPNGIPVWGASSAAGNTIRQELILPAGSYWVLAADQTSFSGSTGGAYTLSTTGGTEPQVGQESETAVTFGAVANGRISAEDHEDEFDGDPATVRRFDGYMIRLLPGEAVTVTLRADFPVSFTRWGLGTGFQEGIFDIPAATTRTITFSFPGPGITYQSFFVISSRHEGRGSYTMSFARATPVPQSSITLRSVTSGGAPANLSDVRGTVVATFTANIPAGASITRFEAGLSTQGCSQAITASQTGTFDLTCSIDTTRLPNGPHVLQGRLITSGGNVLASGMQNVTVNNPALAPSTAVLSPVSAVVTGTRSIDNGAGKLECSMPWRVAIDGSDRVTFLDLTWNYTSAGMSPITHTDTYAANTYAAGTHPFSGGWFRSSRSASGEPEYIPFTVSLSMRYQNQRTGTIATTNTITMRCE